MRAIDRVIAFPTFKINEFTKHNKSLMYLMCVDV